MKNIKNDQRAKDLFDQINELSTNSSEPENYIGTLYKYFNQAPYNQYNLPCSIAIKALEEIKKSKVPDKYLYDLIRCIELENIEAVLAIITGYYEVNPKWGVFLLDDEGNPEIRIEDQELLDEINWDDTMSERFKLENKKKN